MKKIIDTFLFFNEFDILDIRLNELYEYVDYFIITESNKTFSGKDKSFYLTEYIKTNNTFDKFKDKIIINKVIYDKTNKINDDPWFNEHYQRNQLLVPFENRGILKHMHDIIMVSDVDEIPDSSLVELLPNLYNFHDILCVEHKMYYYYLNTILSGAEHTKWKGTVIAPYGISHECKSMTPQELRDYRESILDPKIMEDSGWHFSYLSGKNPKIIKEKLESFAHQEFNSESIKSKIEENILNLTDLFGRNLKITQESLEDLPKYVLENVKKFDHLIYNIEVE